MAERFGRRDDGQGMTVMCPFCGQGVIIEAPEGATYDEQMELARQNCNCVGAQEHRRKQQRIIDSYEYIDRIFHNGVTEDCLRIIKCFRTAIASVVEHDLENVVIKNGKTSYKISLDNDGYLRIQKTYKDVSEEEF